MNIFLKKAVAFFKKHWAIILVVVGGIVAFIATKGKKIPNFADDFMKVRKIHEDELAKIETVRKEEIVQKQAVKDARDASLKTIEVETSDAKKAFEAKKIEETNALLDATKNDAEKLADELSKTTKFKVIPPKD